MTDVYFLSKILHVSSPACFYSLCFVSSLKRATVFHLPHLSRTMGISRGVNELGPELVSDLFGRLTTWARYFVLVCNLLLSFFFFFLFKPSKLFYFQCTNYHLFCTLFWRIMFCRIFKNEFSFEQCFISLFRWLILR